MVARQDDDSLAVAVEKPICDADEEIFSLPELATEFVCGTSRRRLDTVHEVAAHDAQCRS